MAAKKKRKRRKPQNNLLVLRLLILVVLVLAVFEGRLIVTMFTHSRGGAPEVTAEADGQNQEEPEKEPETQTQGSDQPASSSSVADAPLAGLSAWFEGGQKNPEAAPETEDLDDGRISEVIDSPSVVKETEPPIDDSYFTDAVFIGDSRMEGFRNSSGITQGTFLTSVGLSIDRMSEQTIATAEGTISVYQGLSGRQYDKIYLMLGTNDLGYYPWEEFPVNFKNIVEQFHKLQPNAIIYVCSVIYVEEAKITTSYDNNDNVRKINNYLLEVCEQLDYCYYLNLNEIFSNGYGSLIEGASSDGVHLYETYCQQMLDYLKDHYVDVPASSSGETEAVSEAESETETEAGSDNA